MLGIELTPSHIRMVEAAPGPRLKVLKAVSANYFRFRADQAVLASQIRGLIQQEGIKAKTANVVVSGGVHAVAVLPAFKAGEMRLVVQRELRKSAPAASADLSVGYQVLGQASEQGAPKNHVLMIGAPTQAVQQVCLLVEEAGLKIGLISILPVALLQAIQLLDMPLAEGAVAHLKIGSDTSCLAVIRGSMLQFSREIPIGLGTATTAEPALVDRLVAEVKRTALYYRQSFRGEEIRRLVLSGDLADLRPFTGPIMEDLGVEVSIFDPTPSLDLTSLADGPVRFRELVHNFAVPLGLTWQPRAGACANIEATAVKTQPRKGFGLGRAAALVCVVLALAGMVMFYWQTRESIQLRQQRIAALNKQILSLQPRYQEVQEERRLREVQRVRQNFLDGMANQGLVLAKALQEFSLLVPDEMLFRSIKVSGLPGKWQISVDGEVVSEDAPRATAIFNHFLTELRSSHFFSEAGLMQPIQVSNFENGGRAGAGTIEGQLSARLPAGSGSPRAGITAQKLITQPTERAAMSSAQTAKSVLRSRVEFKLGLSIAS